MRLKILTNEKRAGLSLVLFDWSRLKLSRPHPVRGLKVLSEPCFYYLFMMIICKHGIKKLLAQYLIKILKDLKKNCNTGTTASYDTDEVMTAMPPIPERYLCRQSKRRWDFLR